MTDALDAKRWDILLGDCLDLLPTVPEGTVDLAVLDPPYAKENAALYGQVAALVVPLLKPGGSFLALHATRTLPAALADIGATGLEYQWLMAVCHPWGRHSMMYGLRLSCSFKPMSWWSKGTPARKGIALCDSFIAGPPDEKLLHRWAQSDEFGRYLVAMVGPHALILDPMCGTGTVGAVALRYDRRFLGIEMDETLVETARRRCGLAEAWRHEFPEEAEAEPVPPAPACSQLLLELETTADRRVRGAAKAKRQGRPRNA